MDEWENIGQRVKAYVQSQLSNGGSSVIVVTLSISELASLADKVVEDGRKLDTILCHETGRIWKRISVKVL